MNDMDRRIREFMLELRRKLMRAGWELVAEGGAEDATVQHTSNMRHPSGYRITMSIAYGLHLQLALPAGEQSRFLFVALQ